MILTVKPASREEALWVSSRLRPEDRQEVETATGRSAQYAVLTAHAISAECYTVRFNADPDPVVLFGVASNGLGIGVPWFLATPDVRRGSIALLREARTWLESWARKYPDGLVNIADCRNELHLRWLTAAGCALWHTTQVNGHDFIYFTYN